MTRLLADDLQARCDQVTDRIRTNAMASLAQHRSDGRKRRISLTYPEHLRVAPATLLGAHASAAARRSVLSDHAASIRLLFFTNPDGSSFVGLYDIRDERAFLAPDEDSKPLRDLFAAAVWNGTLGSSVH